MSSKSAFAILVAFLLCLSAPSNVFGQTWCTTAQDSCCVGGATNTDYTLPSATSVIWIQYDLTAYERIEVEIKNLDNNQVLFSGQFNCNCVKQQVWTGTALSAGTNIRFKVTCKQCDVTGPGCQTPVATVRFFSPSTNVCAPDCSGG